MAERWWPAGIAERRPIAALLVAFYAAPPDGWDGTLPRIAVSLPLAAAAAVAVRLARLGPVAAGPSAAQG